MHRHIIMYILLYRRIYILYFFCTVTIYLIKYIKKMFQNINGYNNKKIKQPNENMQTY